MEVADENNDGVGEHIETKERRDASENIVWDSKAANVYDLLQQNAARYRLPFEDN